MYSNAQKKFIHRWNWGSIAIALVLMMMMWVTNANGEDCPSDVSPCTCSYDHNRYDITCDNPSIMMADIATAFQSKPAIDIYGLILHIRPEGDLIPEDLLGQSRIIGWLDIRGQNSILAVDPNAFRSSKNSSLNTVYFDGLDTSQMKFDFLTDFPRIDVIKFDHLLNLDRSLPTLPSLPGLTYLRFFDCSDLNKGLTDSVLKCNGLKNLDFYLSSESVPQLRDEGMSSLMNWLLPSSANTLYMMYFNGTSLTRTPSELASFKNISYLTIERNLVNMTVSPGSIYSSTDMMVQIMNSKIVSVEEGAFLGDYAGSRLSFNNNRLTRFEAGAFQSALEQMANSSLGYVSVGDNPFDCYTDPCHLAWITRDNRNLLQHLLGANCNGTGESFAEMSSKNFKKCNAAMLCIPHIQLCLSLITMQSLINYWRSWVM